MHPKVIDSMDKLKEITNPRTYDEGCLAQSKTAIQKLLENDLNQHNADKNFRPPINFYALHRFFMGIYFKYLRIEGLDNCSTLFMERLLESIEDNPWAYEIGRQTNLNTVAVYDVDDVCGSFQTYHVAYFSSLVVTKRDSFIRDLNNQDRGVKERVYEEWGNMLSKEKFDAVKNPVGHFKGLQIKNSTGYMWKSVLW